MALRIHSVDQLATHSPVSSIARQTTSAPAATSTAANDAQTAQSQDAAPSFSAVFAQIAAAAAAAGTTVASTAPAASGTAAASAPAAQQEAPAAASTPAADASSDPAGPLFGPNPWLTDPTGSGPGGVVTNYNPVYFATQQTAQTVAQMLGGKVVESNEIITSPGSPFTQNQPNYMVQLPDGAQVNPGFIADIYAHGWNQSLINEQVANEVAGAEAAVGS